MASYHVVRPLDVAHTPLSELKVLSDAYWRDHLQKYLCKFLLYDIFQFFFFNFNSLKIQHFNFTPEFSIQFGELWQVLEKSNFYWTQFHDALFTVQFIILTANHGKVTDCIVKYASSLIPVPSFSTDSKLERNNIKFLYNLSTKYFFICTESNIF